MVLKISVEQLAQVFGPDSNGDTVEARARSSSRLFVRSQDHLAVYKTAATGRVLTAWEALQAFGFDMLELAVTDGPTVLVPDPREPAESLINRRHQLGLDSDDVARAAEIDVDLLTRAETASERVPIRALERIAVVLGLDERLIAYEPGAGGDSGLAVRLKSLSKGETRFTSATVLTLDEAAWVIGTQGRLQQWLSFEEGWRRFEPSANYGWRGAPIWDQGYFLARQTREILGIPLDEPIRNLRELCEVELGVPLVQLTMPPRIAGATLVNGETRGIAINLAGYNENVWVRRATVAHELGHLLWDPDQQLNSLAVDQYADLYTGQRNVDRMEQRANAFAAEFLAPQAAVSRVFDEADTRENGLRAVMETFGVSYSLARYQIWNASNQMMSLDSLRVKNTTPTMDWEALETYAVDYFPIRSVPSTRRGEFAGAVVAAEKAGLISRDTACSYLRCSESEYIDNRERIAGLFPTWLDAPDE